MLLVLNAGSSTLKFALYEEERLQARGLIDRLNGQQASAPMKVKNADGRTTFQDAIAAQNHEQALPLMLEWLTRSFPGAALTAVGHRVVHGGDRFTLPTRLDEEAIRHLEALVPLAPLHQPHALGPIRVLSRLRPELPQVACFDTAFHAGQSELERRYALPRSYFDKGIKKYGFHGLSYEYIASRLKEVDPEAAAGRTVVFHLGNGASMCALEAGRSVATTMGFTALDGLVMGTRTGSIDPGVLLHFLQQEKMTADALADLLYKQSGLLGISGISGDMRELLASDRPEAAEAVELFCHRAAGELGRLVMILQGVDALVFTAGIGEQAAAVRARICKHAAWLGVQVDASANEANRTPIHAGMSRVRIHVIPTDEERMIARQVRALLLA